MLQLCTLTGRLLLWLDIVGNQLKCLWTKYVDYNMEFIQALNKWLGNHKVNVVRKEYVELRVLSIDEMGEKLTAYDFHGGAYSKVCIVRKTNPHFTVWSIEEIDEHLTNIA
ncbi:hypothetical protein CUMW_111300, partial [Citrus unshiu]